MLKSSPHHTRRIEQWTILISQDFPTFSNTLTFIAFFFQVFSIIISFQISSICFSLLSNFIQPATTFQHIFLLLLFIQVKHSSACVINYLHFLLANINCKLNKIRLLTSTHFIHSLVPMQTKRQGIAVHRRSLPSRVGNHRAIERMAVGGASG